MTGQPISRHALPLAAAMGLAAAMPAAADPGAALTAALDRFQSACALALSDPDAYIASLTLPGPSGEPGTYASPDGAYVLVHTAQAEGLTDMAEFSRLGGLDLRRCTISAIIPDHPDASEIARIVRPMLDRRAQAVVGGKIPRVTPIWEPGDEAATFEGEPGFVYYATGLLDGADAPATIRANYGELKLSAAATVRSGEPIR